MNDILELGAKFLEDGDEVLIDYLRLLEVIACCTFDEPSDYGN
tara:strand:+ start:27 stop:155 length:129 start_codon:yes stop_codon:yes gene_type:complete